MSVVVLEESEWSPETIERMAPVWEAAYAALRVDIGTLEDLGRAAARAAAARDERVAQAVPVVTEVKSKRPALAEDEKRERHREAQRRYAAKRRADRTS